MEELRPMKNCSGQISRQYQHSLENYSIQYNFEGCLAEDEVKFIACDIVLSSESMSADSCMLDPRRKITDIKLPDNFTIVGRQEFIKDLFPCSIPKVSYQCQKADEMEQARYVMYYLNQVNQSTGQNSAGRAPAIPKAQEQSQGTMIADDRNPPIKLKETPTLVEVEGVPRANLQ